MSKYTPGPWPNMNLDIRYDEVVEPGSPAIRIHSHYNITREEIEANANLIAAAPELLEALESFVHSCKHQSGLEKGELDWNRQTAIKIIKKAKGES